jgi:hypothetical protein
VIEFGSDGWSHVDPERDCPLLIVAFPPPLREDADH